MHDLQNSVKFLEIPTTDLKAFELGVNIATTAGKVIFRNELMELIYYTPTQNQNYQIPILITPPWINKYYILDLTEKKSMVKWLLEMGYSVFMISWINPDNTLAHKDFEDYMLEGPVQAIKFIREKFKVQTVSAIGYCIGGTLLASTLAYLAKKSLKYVSAAVFFTTLLDFSDAGDISAFLDEEMIDKIELQMDKLGYFDGKDLAATFSMLRANEMIWNFFINNYLLGKSN